MASRNPLNINDGMCPNLVHGALYDGIFQVPKIKRPKEILIPTGITPFSQRKKFLFPEDIIGFNEYDDTFAEVIRNPNEFYDDFSRYLGIMSPDFSMYRNASTSALITNVYRNRAVGHYYQSHGINVYPLIRWGDERTYTTEVFPECMAFAGVERNSIVCISPYGCIKGAENKDHFKRGLAAMIEVLAPSDILVYGPTPHCVFDDFSEVSNFHFYPDWITRMKGGH